MKFIKIGCKKYLKAVVSTLFKIGIILTCLPLAFGLVAAAPRKFADKTGILMLFVLSYVFSVPLALSAIDVFLVPLSEALSISPPDDGQIVRTAILQVSTLLVGFAVGFGCGHLKGAWAVAGREVHRRLVVKVLACIAIATSWQLVDADRGATWSVMAPAIEALGEATPEQQDAIRQVFSEMLAERE